MSDVQPAEDLQQLLKERDGLRELVSEQLAAATTHTARIHALEEDLQNLQNATKLAAQVVAAFADARSPSQCMSLGSILRSI